MNCQQNCRGRDGKLPSVAPLANPYVPFQLDNPPVYDSPKALVRGTLYPGLDLPFRGMVNKTNKSGASLQSLSFTVQELALYLDTHQWDQDALELYRTYQEQLQKARHLNIQKHGPLTHQDVVKGDYAWLDDPWPWEYAANQEG